MWLHQTKKALNSKGNNQQNQQVTNWKGENTYKSRMSDKGLVSGKQINSKNPIWSKKRAEDLNKHSSTEDIQMANRSAKRGTGVPVVRETQIKTTRCHPTPIRMAITRELSPQGNRAWWPTLTRLTVGILSQRTQRTRLHVWLYVSITPQRSGDKRTEPRQKPLLYKTSH